MSECIATGLGLLKSYTSFIPAYCHKCHQMQRIIVKSGFSLSQIEIGLVTCITLKLIDFTEPHAR